jgi:hypothetical protein
VAPPYTTNDDCSGGTAPLSRALEESRASDDPRGRSGNPQGLAVASPPSFLRKRKTALDASPGSPQHDRGHDNLSASGSNVHGG